MGEQTKNLLIGVFVLAASALILWLILFLKPTVGDGKQTIYIRFSDVNKVNVGTRVMFAGKPVGEVVAIEEIHDARAKPSTDPQGRLYYYQVTVKIDSKIKVYTIDKVSIQTSGLLGEKSISITPEPAPKGVTPKLVTDQPIYAESADPIEQAFRQLSDLSDEMKKTFNEVTISIQKNGNDVSNSIRSFGGAMDEIKITVQSINECNIIQDVKTSIQNFSDTICDVQDAIRELKEADTFKNAGLMVQHLKDASCSIETVAKDLADGKGTLGKLIQEDDFYLRMTAVMSKIDTLMNDVNHYGILFHLNKGWQRQRSQRITTLNALDNPANFKSYFQTEVSEINTAMSRISMVIDKAQEGPQREEILNDPLFQKDFAELLRQARELSDNLKLYNEQLQQAKNGTN